MIVKLLNYLCRANPNTEAVDDAHHDLNMTGIRRVDRKDRKQIERESQVNNMLSQSLLRKVMDDFWLADTYESQMFPYKSSGIVSEVGIQMNITHPAKTPPPVSVPNR